MYNFERFGNAKDAITAYEREKKDNNNMNNVSIVEWLYSQKEKYFMALCKKCGHMPVIEQTGGVYYVCHCNNCGLTSLSAINEEKAVRNWNNLN